MLQLNHLLDVVEQLIGKRIRVLGDEIGAIIFQIGRDAFHIAISLDDTFDTFIGDLFTDVVLIIGTKNKLTITTFVIMIVL